MQLFVPIKALTSLAALAHTFQQQSIFGRSCCDSSLLTLATSSSMLTRSSGQRGSFQTQPCCLP
eukprot:1208593-Amphidinium_carterae.1